MMKWFSMIVALICGIAAVVFFFSENMNDFMLYAFLCTINLIAANSSEKKSD